MKKVFTLAMIVGFLWGTYAFAGCPLTGNTYTLEHAGITYELSGFECLYGPGCSGTCEVWEKISASSARYLGEFPFTCWEDGAGFINGCPFALSNSGNLKILLADVSNYKCHTIGTKMYCFPEEIESVLLNRKNKPINDECTGINFLLNSNCWDIYDTPTGDGMTNDCYENFPNGHPQHCFACGPCPNGHSQCTNNRQCLSGYCDLSDFTCKAAPPWQYEHDCNYYFLDGHPEHCATCGPCVNGEGPCFANSQCISDYCDQTTHICQEDPRQSK